MNRLIRPSRGWSQGHPRSLSTALGILLVAAVLVGYVQVSKDLTTARAQRDVAQNDLSVAQSYVKAIQKYAASAGVKVPQEPALQAVPGEAGAPGNTGATGATGLTGPPGLKGDVGPMGATGAVGSTGLSGATGAVGATGAQGTSSVGATGPTGPPGPTGATGTAGADGTNGVDGAPGATGAQGPAGPTCPAGYALTPETQPDGSTGMVCTNGATTTTTTPVTLPLIG
jgi:hypothetical protein